MGAMALRGIFIFAGAALINAFEWLLYLFGALVIVSGIRLLLKKDSSKNIGDSKLLRLLRRRLKVVEDSQDESFFVRREGKLRVTQLDRKSVVEGKSVSVRVDLGGRRIIK